MLSSYLRYHHSTNFHVQEHVHDFDQPMASDITFKPSVGQTENSKELLYGATLVYLTAMNRKRNPISHQQRVVLLAKVNAAMEHRLAVQAIQDLESKKSASTTYHERAQTKLLDFGELGEGTDESGNLTGWGPL